jgi:hypothetical protein
MTMMCVFFFRLFDSRECEFEKNGKKIKNYNTNIRMDAFTLTEEIQKKRMRIDES